MKNLHIFDFDGVLFQHPSHCIQEMAKEMPEALLWRIGMEGGFFSSEMIQDALIKPYYEAFVERYFSKKMARENVLRLVKFAETGNLVIASLNNTWTIERHLELSGIRHLFKLILARDMGYRKPEMLKIASSGYDPEKEITFITDTVEDILIAKEFCPKIKIKAVASGIDSLSSLVDYVGESNITDPFY